MFEVSKCPNKDTELSLEYVNFLSREDPAGDLNLRCSVYRWHLNP